jgi:hypothetical protein
MSKRERKLLLRDYKRLDGTAAAYVHDRIQGHMLSVMSDDDETDVVLFCLEIVPPSDCLLLKIRAWIDEVVRGDEEDTSAFIARVCRVCGSQETLASCSRCQKVYYCGKPCQKADWTRHKTMCKACSYTSSYVVMG